MGDQVTNGSPSGRLEGHLALVASPTDVPHLRDFLQALEALGVRVEVVAPAVGREAPTVLVVLSPRLAADAEVDADLRLLVDGTATNVLPLMLEGPVDLLADVSQIHLNRGPELAAQRVALLTRAGPADVVSWNRLTSAAREWDASGRPRSGLLGRSDAQTALQLLAGPIGAIDPANSGLLRLCAQESRTKLRRRSAAVRAGGVVVAFVLIGGTAVAINQRATAQRAEREATAQADRSAATRLNALAGDLVAVDPDLPWIFAGLALEREPSTETVDMAVALASSARRHRTIALRAVPFGLAVAADLGVIDLGDAGFDVYNVVTGDLVHSDPTLELDSVKLSSDAQTLIAMDEFGSTIMLDTGSWKPRLSADLPGGVVDIATSSNGQAAVLTADGITLVDLGSGNLRSVVLPPELGEVLQVALADDGLYAADEEQVAALDLGTGSLIGLVTLPQNGIVELHASPESVLVVGPRELTTISLDELDGDAGSATEDAYEPGTRTGTVASSTVVDGVLLGGDETGGVTLLDARYGSPYRQFPAHRGAVAGVGASSDGTLVTVGYDRAMRLWEQDALANLNPSPFGYEGYVQTGFEESHRNLIVAGQGSDVATVSLVDSEETVMLDRQTVEVIDRGRVNGLLDPARPTNVAGKVYKVNIDSQKLQVIDLPNQSVASTEIPGGVLGWSFLTSASPDGEWFALADASRLLVHSPDGAFSVTELGVVTDPVAVWVDNDGAAGVIDTRGAVHTSDGDRRAVRIGNRPIVAATPLKDGRYLVATVEGTVLEIAGSESRVVGEVDTPNRPQVLRVSPDGLYVALIGPDSTDVIAIGDGALVARLTSWESAHVSDVAFDDDSSGGLLVRSNGIVERFDMFPDGSALSFIADNQPRDVTAADLELAAIEGDE